MGATTEAYLGYFREAGFDRVETLAQLDYLSRSASEEMRRVASSFGARSMVVRAVKPQ